MPAKKSGEEAKTKGVVALIEITRGRAAERVEDGMAYISITGCERRSISEYGKSLKSVVYSRLQQKIIHILISDQNISFSKTRYRA